MTEIVADKSATRKKLLISVVAIIAVCAISASAYWIIYGSRFVSTDNAYAAVEVAQITPSTSGTIQEVKVKDTEAVKKGDILVIIDDTDAKLTYAKLNADLVRAEANLSSAKIDYDRRAALVESGSVSKEELTDSENALKVSQAIRDSSKAAVDQAQVDLERTIVRSPVDGVVAKRQVQLGQRVQAGAPLLSVVPIEEMHVDANFKEGQLEHVKVGQRATVKADIYGSDVEYQGVVEGFAGGSGAAFSAIPAQNATGNWIKVVQRLPVRIRLNPEQLRVNPLKVGLSMDVTIDTKSQAQ